MSLTYEACITTARQQLQSARDALHQEISQYPSPIAGCDAQFNHLLAERQKVLEALSVLGQEFFVPTPRSPDPAAGVETR